MSKEDKIPTAEEFVEKTNLYSHKDDAGDKVYYDNHTHTLMIEFAKLHVQKALESATENAKIKTEYYHEEDVGRIRLREILDSSDLASERTDGDGIMYAVDTYEVNKQSILNAYPLENIK